MSTARSGLLALAGASDARADFGARMTRARRARAVAGRRSPSRRVDSRRAVRSDAGGPRRRHWATRERRASMSEASIARAFLEASDAAAALAARARRRADAPAVGASDGSPGRSARRWTPR